MTHFPGSRYGHWARTLHFLSLDQERRAPCRGFLRVARGLVDQRGKLAGQSLINFRICTHKYLPFLHLKAICAVQPERGAGALLQR